MNQHINSIANRLSLRAPQRESLVILDRVCEIISLNKDADVAYALDTIRSEFPTVEAFERDFPSLCFALATGVGKTRLMGAFIAYLHRAHHLNHFFVLAPNLTIYNKLIADFTPGTPKYVFQGISEFATSPPEIINGDNYQGGRGVRLDPGMQGRLFDEAIHINIFNISKINSEVRGDRAPRIRRLSEYIGESYFDYLSRLGDLVLLMDESHRYRASAGVRAINELKPILGLELTATPQIERGVREIQPFKNIIYSYPLSSAMQDGFVKEPAVATRENFNAAHYNEQELERIKIEDGVRIHEYTKVELEVYARERGVPQVKPFMLVVAKDIEHARSVQRLIEADDFFEGNYKGKVITVESTLRGEEKDETVEQLMNVEKSGNPTEIVIHVNMLKEGWDVTNLYTIVPLRTANSRTLVEQSIGRGLRLPYGKRVGVPTVDRLTIVSHDRFAEIVAEANNPNSIIRTGVVIGRDIPDRRPEVREVRSNLDQALDPAYNGTARGKPAFETRAEYAVAQTTTVLIRERFQRLARSTDLRSPDVQRELVREVTAALVPPGTMAGVIEPELPVEQIERIVAQVVELHIELTIDIPRIVIVPRGETSGGFRPFQLALDFRLLPVDSNILIQELHSRKRDRLMRGETVDIEERLEDYLVRKLIDFDDVSYDDHAELLYDLAEQVVNHLRSYLGDDEDVENVLIHNEQALAKLIHTQMQEHYEAGAPAGYEARVTQGFTTLRPSTYSMPEGESPRDFRVPVEDRRLIPSLLFTSFQHSLYSIQRFQSGAELEFARLLEDEPSVEKWVKPAPGTFPIYYGDDRYEPDFVVETTTAKYLCEPKAANEMTDSTVQKKARAAARWCAYATQHEQQHGGKPWHYLLIPDDVIKPSATLQGLVAQYMG